MELFVVGKVIPENPGEWEFCGVFDTIEKAEEKCLDFNYFVGPCKLNEYVGDAVKIWPNAYYPKGEN